MKLARAEGARTILDPAPARPLPASLLAQVDILTPNESEARMLLGRAAARVSLADAPELAKAVRALVPSGAVILKLGDQGCLWFDGEPRASRPGVRSHRRRFHRRRRHL